jgi:hypothetical protein
MPSLSLQACIDAAFYSPCACVSAEGSRDGVVISAIVAC